MNFNMCIISGVHFQEYILGGTFSTKSTPGNIGQSSIHDWAMLPGVQFSKITFDIDQVSQLHNKPVKSIFPVNNILSQQPCYYILSMLKMYPRKCTLKNVPAATLINVAGGTIIIAGFLKHPSLDLGCF